jgi:hypothetical protein
MQDEEEENQNPFRQSSAQFLPSEEGTMSRNHPGNHKFLGSSIAHSIEDDHYQKTLEA